ncbi:MAG: uroporphyrinogen-III synthase [Coriobacteriia bacterium]|nr:uroporphyrinogen-III synthase [Coriobacteriia bacterium]
MAPTDRTDTRDPGAPLAGRSVVVTRAADQAAGLAEPLEALGAEVLLLPVIAVADPLDWSPVDAAIAELDTYDWIVLTSTNGVDRFDGRLRSGGTSLAEVAGARVAVVGSATAVRLREHGVEPALVPDRFHAEGLVEAMRHAGAGPGTRVLVPRAEEAREVLPDELRSMGCTVDVVHVYRLVTAPAEPGVVARLASGGVDAVTFASGGTARRFIEMLLAAGVDPDAVMRSVMVASIGPVTTEALRELGFEADLEARESTAESLAEALAGRLADASPPA